MLAHGRPRPISKALYLQADSKGRERPKGITCTLTKDGGFSTGTPGEFSSRYMQPVCSYERNRETWNSGEIRWSRIMGWGRKKQGVQAAKIQPLHFYSSTMKEASCQMGLFRAQAIGDLPSVPRASATE